MKVPKAKKLKSGSWFIQLRLNGESVPITTTSKRVCEDTARIIKAEHLAGQRKKPVGKDITLRQAVDAYIESRDNLLSPSTIRGYINIRNTRFREVIDKRLKDIKDWQILCNNERKQNGQAVSPKTLINSWRFICAVMRYHKIDVPELSLPQIVKKNQPWIEPEDIYKFLIAINGDSCELQILLTMHGLRVSEVLAVVMDKSKIDLKRNNIIVRGAVVLDKDGKLVKKDTNKNTSSQRVVPILIPRLIALSKSIDEITIYHSQTVRNHINKACEKIGIAPVGAQGLRRSFASLCYHLKLSERETMELGGWSDANTMRKIYIELAKRDKQKATRKLSEFFKNANDNANDKENSSEEAL
jgi:integrase